MRRAVVLQTLMTSLAIAGSARATEPTKEECISANESGQDLRRAGRLTEARQRFELCSATSCPAVLRDDCVERLDDVQRSMPTIVFEVKDRDGRSVEHASISVDGVPARSTMELDPGEHGYQITAAGHEPASGKFVLQEGVKGREEVVTLEPAGVARDVPTRESRPTQRYVAYAVGSVGIVAIGVGTYFGLLAKATYDDASSPSNCPQGPASCSPEGVAGGERANDQAAVSTFAFVLGGALLAGGAVLFVTAPKDRAVSIAPAIGPTSAGINAGARW